MQENISRKKVTLPKRVEAQPEYTWDAHSIFPSDAEWEAAVQQIQVLLAQAADFKGRLKESPAILAEFMAATESLMLVMGKVFVYASMFHAVDTTDPEAADKNDRAGGLFGQLQAALAFDEPELLEIGFETLDVWLQQEPRLSIYAHYLDELKRRQEHVRSAEVEEVLGMVMDSFRTAASTHAMLADADFSFPPAIPADESRDPQPLAPGSIDALLADHDREVRRTAWENYADVFLAHRNGLATCLSAGVKQNVFLSRVRRYDSSLQAALSESNIPVEVFHNTLATFQKHLPTWHRYWRVRRQALGYGELREYDIRAPLTKVNPEVSYAQATEWIINGMAPLGSDYVKILRRGLLHERWVDVYPNEGKRSGAFSTGFKGTHPFILTNHSDDLFSMSMLAHELGHSMHSYYSREAQPLIYANYSLFVAEVASNFSQALVRAYLLDQKRDPEFQIALIEEAMYNFHRYFFIMPILARFELEIHQRVEQGRALTAESMIALMADLFQEGYGQELVVDRERTGITWAQFPNHLYANYYVFQYATGIAGAHALASGVLSGTPGAAEDYVSFLKAGGSLYPLEALALAGVDMASPEPVEKTFHVMAKLVDQLETLTSARSDPGA